MKDSTIFKLAAGAGILAFVARLVLVQPEDLGVRPGIRGDRPSDEISRLVQSGDFPGALRVAAIRQQARYLDQGGWNRIGDLLYAMNEGVEAPFDAVAALEVFRQNAPKDWVERTGAMGWAAYFLGFQVRSEEAGAMDAWRYGAQAFDTLVRERPEDAGAWDWLYRARTYMRLADQARARQALRDASVWADAALADLDDSTVVDDPVNYVRTLGRTWASVGGVEETASLWTRLTEALLDQAPPVVIAEGWRQYGGSMYRSDEDAAGDLAVEMSLVAIDRVAPDDVNGAVRAAPLLWEASRRFERQGRIERAEEAWRRAIAFQRVGAEGTDDGQEWIDLAEMLALRVGEEEALAALERGVAAGFRNPDHLWSDEAFTALHEDPRFLALITRIEEEIEGLLAPQREAIESARRARETRLEGRRPR